jgi:hypothetical protein
VVNLDFNGARYLQTLEADGLNLTRLFSGTYVEPAGAFGIAHNTMAPAEGRFLAPWARSDQPGYPGGGNKFDLDRISPEYLDRLCAFVAEADRRGVVVELVLFCSTYNDDNWRIHPFNPANNIQALAIPGWKTLNTLENGPALAYQERFVRAVVQALNGFDNLYYEIQNEPWADFSEQGEVISPYWTEKTSWPNGVQIPTAASVAWQAEVARWITEEESRLPAKHLIAQNVANFRLSIRPADLALGVGLVNFHYAYPEAATWNLGLPQVLGCNETGFAGPDDATYRRQAWRFMLAGGGLFNHLDYSFSVGHEDGNDPGNRAPGGGSPALRRELGVLGRFLRAFDLATMRPDPLVVRSQPGLVAWALSQPGSAYALYLEGRGNGPLGLDLPAGRWAYTWTSTADGVALGSGAFAHEGGVRQIEAPAFNDGVALRVTRDGP